MRHILLYIGIFLLFIIGKADAQYVPIPDESSTSGCPGDPTQCSGYKVRTDMNNRFSGVILITPLLATQKINTTSITYAQSPFTATSTYGYYDCNATLGNIVIHLPAAIGTFNSYTFKKTDSSSNTCTIDVAVSPGTDTIDGNSSYILATQYSNAIIADVASGEWDLVNTLGNSTSTNIYPNTRPLAGQILIGNNAGTAYAPITLNGSCTLTYAGVISCGLTAVTYSELPNSCTPGQELFCSNCENVSDGVTMASQCQTSGTGSVAVCKSNLVSPPWSCGQ